MRIPLLRETVGLAKGAVGLVEDVVGALLGRGRDDDEPAAAPSAPPAAAPVSAVVPPPEPVSIPIIEAQPEPEPDELVASFGAEDGVGATLRVDEPWPGYRAMSAPDITDRLVVSDAATLAAVKLYESSHRDRKSVITEVEKRLAKV